MRPLVLLLAALTLLQPKYAMSAYGDNQLSIERFLDLLNWRSNPEVSDRWRADVLLERFGWTQGFFHFDMEQLRLAYWIAGAVESGAFWEVYLRAYPGAEKFVVRIHSADMKGEVNLEAPLSDPHNPKFEGVEKAFAQGLRIILDKEVIFALVKELRPVEDRYLFERRRRALRTQIKEHDFSRALYLFSEAYPYMEHSIREDARKILIKLAQNTLGWGTARKFEKQILAQACRVSLEGS